MWDVAVDRKEYEVSFSETAPRVDSPWESPPWDGVESLDVAFFRPESSSHRPATRCKLLYSASRLHGIFRIDDRYVRCIRAGFQAEVFKDSCVEFFVQPKPGAGYFNFEFNCGGAMLASYVYDPVRVGGRVRGCSPLSLEEAGQVLLYHDMPDRVEPETEHDVVWHLGFSLPFSLLERYVGSIGEVGGQVWRANFYKCGDETSHPHWGSWQPIAERNFHDPSSFGDIRFKKLRRTVHLP